jgi:membrane associated rhomboid family serine protease
MGGLVPLSDASRRPVRIPIVTALIIVVNVIVFGMELVHGEPFVMQWAAIPDQIVSGHRWITMLTAMFMHASWSHIIGNMVFFWAFGPEVEDAMGRGRYLVFYLIGGLVANLAQVVADPHSTVPNLGASGAIAAVMGAFPACLLIGFWFLTQVINAGQVAHAQTGGVAYLAHIGGFIYGVVIARLFIRRVGTLGDAA